MVKPMNIVGISGSPSIRSRSAWLLELAQAQFKSSANVHHSIAVRELPAAALIAADASHLVLREAIARIADADVLIVSTPIYKAAYSGLLKLFLDVLPQDALRGKAVLPSQPPSDAPPMHENAVLPGLAGWRFAL